MEGMACKLELMKWFMSGFQAGSGWSLRSRTTTSSAMVLLSEAVRDAWSFSFFMALRPLPGEGHRSCDASQQSCDAS